MTRFVNKYQTKEERRFKYHMMKELGFSAYEARQYRDFRFTRLVIMFGVK